MLHFNLGKIFNFTKSPAATIKDIEFILIASNYGAHKSSRKSGKIAENLMDFVK